LFDVVRYSTEESIRICLNDGSTHGLPMLATSCENLCKSGNQVAGIHWIYVEESIDTFPGPETWCIPQCSNTSCWTWESAIQIEYILELPWAMWILIEHNIICVEYQWRNTEMYLKMYPVPENRYSARVPRDLQNKGIYL
jgi:hypothetical protein